MAPTLQRLSRPALLAWSLCGIACLAALLTFGFQLLLPIPLSFGQWMRFLVRALSPVVYSAVGALIITHHPRHRIGWLLSVAGACFALAIALQGYATIGLPRPVPLPGSVVAAWVGSWLFTPYLYAVWIGLPLLFPDERWPSGRWRIFALVTAVFFVVWMFLIAFTPDTVTWQEEYSIANPFAIPGLEVVEGRLEETANLIFGVCLLLVAFAVLLRYRRAGWRVRQQLKWLGYLFLVLVLWGGFSGILAESEEYSWLINIDAVLGVLLNFGIPVAIGIAILRYRLYDIDLIINRTLVYATLTSVLLLVYLVTVVILQNLFRTLSGQTSDFVIVLSTFGIAVLFHPLRRHIQDFIDRRFYRRKYDVEKTLAAYSAALRDEANADLDEVTEELLAVIAETMQPMHLSLWLREPRSNP